MYRNGHLGVSLLVFAPVGYTLVRLGYPVVAAVTGAVMVWFAMLPDIDHRLPLVEHRGATHSLAFAVLVGGIGAAVGIAADRIVDVGLALPQVGFAIGALTVLAHLIGDTLTPAGVSYLWPLSKRTVSVSLARADNRLANGGLLALGVVVTAGWLGIVLGLV